MYDVTRIRVPDLYRAMTGNTKKRFAWAYLKKYYPYYEPLKEQPELEANNELLVKFNPEKAREVTQEANHRREENKKLKKARKKK